MRNMKELIGYVEYTEGLHPTTIVQRITHNIERGGSSHSERTALLSSRIYRKTIQDPNDAEHMHLLMSALFHDIGKNGVDENILGKPKPLSQVEYGSMQTHVEKTEWLLCRCDDLRNTTIPFIAASHHERWDGTGYPRGLKGTCIPRLTRIISVADIWDALVHERCYKKEYSPATGLVIMKSLRETSCDPLFIDALVSLV